MPSQTGHHINMLTNILLSLMRNTYIANHLPVVPSLTRGTFAPPDDIGRVSVEPITVWSEAKLNVVTLEKYFDDMFFLKIFFWFTDLHKED